MPTWDLLFFFFFFFTLKVYQEFKPMWQIIEKWLISQSMQCLKWSEASTLVGTAVYFPERPICSQIQINENRESCQKCSSTWKVCQLFSSLWQKKWLMTQIPRSWQLAGFLFSVSTLPDSFNISYHITFYHNESIWFDWLETVKNIANKGNWLNQCNEPEHFLEHFMHFSKLAFCF